MRQGKKIEEDRKLEAATSSGEVGNELEFTEMMSEDHGCVLSKDIRLRETLLPDEYVFIATALLLSSEQQLFSLIS